MTNIKTLDERIDAHLGATVTLDELLAMSREEAKELRAALEIGIPSGWQLVPKEPTDDMVVAFAEQWYSKCQCIDDPDMLDAYKAMLEVAPQPEDAK